MVTILIRRLDPGIARDIILNVARIAQHDVGCSYWSILGKWSITIILNDAL